MKGIVMRGLQGLLLAASAATMAADSSRRGSSGRLRTLLASRAVARRTPLRMAW